jgi:hypothetical protein
MAREYIKRASGGGGVIGNHIPPLPRRYTSGMEIKNIRSF